MFELRRKTDGNWLDHVALSDGFFTKEASYLWCLLPIKHPVHSALQKLSLLYLQISQCQKFFR